MYICIHVLQLQHASLNNQTFTEEQNKMLLLTTVGKVIFNEILPETFPYINEPTDLTYKLKHLKNILFLQRQM